VRWLERQWYRRSLWTVALLPFGVLFSALSTLRRAAYRFGWLKSERLPVALIVVGNITVGGSGKTPLVLWLVKWLKQHGCRPGIVSRGYGGSADAPMRAAPDGDAALVGDEPLLLARRGDCPVWIGRDRVAAGRALLAAHPECNVIVGDDGLQHYRLHRDVEIAVVDGQRRFGNGCLLPAGPLREGVGRLREVDAVVVNGDETVVLPGAVFYMRLQGAVLRNLRSGASVDAKMFQGSKLHAVAGIGNPERFFDHLRGLGLVFEAHAFPDHHAFVAGDLNWDDADAILMTEKDAVKCAAFASDRHWMLAVEAEVDPGLGQLVLNKLKGVR
jgi:tetraacyldisaccharide 4'-kinase